MGKFTIIPQNTFDALQLDAGVLLWRFDPETGAPPADEDIICATTGGISASCIPTYTDMGSDVDNVPDNMMELKKLNSWNCTLTTNSLGMSPELIALALGAADIDGTHVTPRGDLKMTDFKELWWVGDKANGGFAAIKVFNALSTSGFALKTTKNGKGQVAITITGHVSIAAQKVVPMQFYSADAEGEKTYTITNNLTNATNSNIATEVMENATYSATITADAGYTLTTVTVVMGGIDITNSVYTAATGEISIPNVTSTVVITATAE